MKFSDQGIIIAIKKYGEDSLLLKVFSHHHGVFSSFVKSAKSSKNKAIFQVGNLISFEYRSRIDDNLGQLYYVDLAGCYLNKIIFDRLKFDCVNSLFSIVDNLFLERESCVLLFEKLHSFLQKIICENITKKEILSDYIKLELKILKTLGYGIDLSSCIVTGSKSNLVFVSPKSACAVSFEAGEPYKNKLLNLPNFLLEENSNYNESHLLDGLKLSGFFLNKFLFCEKNFNNKNHLFHRNNIEKSIEGNKAVFI